ncbi:hypothetical protein [Gemmatimonas sp.]|uniref:hypothetical protein n=1 Tax=Gemmatimonas sp. TaxID=1962908 RepID=UPI003561AD6B
MTEHWLSGHDDITEGALWHGDGLEMVRAVGQAATPVQMIFPSPPYGIGKPYEEVMSISHYVAWQTDAA